MKFAIERREASAASADVVVSGLFEAEGKDDRPPVSLLKEDKGTGGLLTPAWKRKEIRGKRREVTVFHRPDGRGRWVVVGLGTHGRFSADTVRRAAAEAVRAVRGRGARTLAFRLSSFVDGPVSSAIATRALVDGGILGGYEFTRYRKTSEGGIEEVTIQLGEEHASEERTLTSDVTEEVKVAENVLWTRDIANLPADTATPERLAEFARALGKEMALKVTVFDERELAKMHCGGLLAVGGGSDHPPRLVVLEYPGGTRRGRTVAVVGKGITFDWVGSRSRRPPGWPR